MRDGEQTLPTGGLARGLGLLGLAVGRYVRHGMGVYAAAISFWAMVGLVPLLAMLVFAVALFVEPDVVESSLDQIAERLPGETVEVFTEQVGVWVEQSVRTSTVGLVVAVLVTSWGASAGVAHMMRAINVAHDLTPRNYVHRRFAALVHVVASLVLVVPIIVLVAATPGAMAAADVPTLVRWIVGIARWPVILLLFGLLLGLLYWAAPTDERRFRALTPGVLVGSVIFLIGSAAFSVYAANVDKYDASYGTLATVVVTMLWIYITVTSILVGGEVDAAIEAAEGDPSDS